MKRGGIRKNIRMKIKNQAERNLSLEELEKGGSVEKVNASANSEFSFNKVKADYQPYEEENMKIKREAKELIEKTRKMMEKLDLDKVRALDSSTGGEKNKNQILTLSERPISPLNHSFSSNERIKRSLSREKTNPNSISMVMGNSLVDDEIYLKNHINFSIKNLTQRLLDKTKFIKQLEKELKEKNSQLDVAHEKVKKKNEEIEKLNELLMKEMSNNLKVEIATLNRKMITKDKTFEEKKKMMEDMIEEYKGNIFNSLQFNQNSVDKIKELEKQNASVLEENEKLHTTLVDLDNNIKYLKEKTEIEQTTKGKMKIELENTQTQLKSLVMIIRNLVENYKLSIPLKFHSKINYFFQNDIKSNCKSERERECNALSHDKIYDGRIFYNQSYQHQKDSLNALNQDYY